MAYSTSPTFTCCPTPDLVKRVSQTANTSSKAGTKGGRFNCDDCPAPIKRNSIQLRKRSLKLDATSNAVSSRSCGVRRAVLFSGSSVFVCLMSYTELLLPHCLSHFSLEAWQGGFEDVHDDIFPYTYTWCGR